ncbi:GAF domain-containing protein [Oxalobacteraceae bacterium]|nr:GAF domain-containing protein [Oxalobacteraceae bacterium]
MKQSNAVKATPTILIASNAAFELAALRQILQRYGFELDCIVSADAAQAAIVRGNVAALLLDAALAGPRLEQVARLGHAGSAQVPVFLLTADDCGEHAILARSAGAAGCLALPLQTEDAADQILLELGVLSAPSPSDPQLANMVVNYHKMLSGSPDTVMLLDLETHRIVDTNRNAARLYGRPESEIRQLDLVELCPPLQPDGRPSSELLASCLAQVLAGDIRLFEIVFEHSSGRAITCETRMVMLPEPGRRLLHLRMIDATGRKLAEALRAGQNELLELIARGDPLTHILARLALLIEGQSDGVLCALHLLDIDGSTMRNGAAPSLPPSYMAALDGIQIGPAVGSCGSAMYLREAVIVSDIEHDPLWQNYRDLAAMHRLRACWSMPIMEQGTMLGSFAMYYREPRSPSAEDRRVISVAVHLAGIAMARTRREEELRRHREHLEELVEARTMALRQAMDDAEQANEELSTALDNLSLTQDELVRRDKLAALGTLVAGVAHELNTPIGNSLMMASTMGERTRDVRAKLDAGMRRSELLAYLEHAAEADDVVVRNLQRAADLVASFKRIAVDSASSQRRRFQLDQVVSELVLPLHAAVKHPALAVKQDIAPGLELDSYPGPLCQALSNLFENSLIHGLDNSPGGVIVIRARAAPNGEITLSLSDNGVGIPPAHLTRVFDPFFTTRLGEGGSGLGLYITHDIVTGVLGGRIEASSRPGQGSCFTMVLPAVAPL